MAISFTLTAAVADVTALCIAVRFIQVFNTSQSTHPGIWVASGNAYVLVLRDLDTDRSHTALYYTVHTDWDGAVMCARSYTRYIRSPPERLPRWTHTKQKESRSRFAPTLWAMISNWRLQKNRVLSSSSTNAEVTATATGFVFFR